MKITPQNECLKQDNAKTFTLSDQRLHSASPSPAKVVKSPRIRHLVFARHARPRGEGIVKEERGKNCSAGMEEVK